MSALGERLVKAVAVVLVDHTPGDEHAEPAARKAVAAALQELTIWAGNNEPLGRVALGYLTLEVEVGEAKP